MSEKYRCSESDIKFNIICESAIMNLIHDSNFLASYIPNLLIKKKEISETKKILIKKGISPDISAKWNLVLIKINNRTSYEDIITLIEYWINYFRQKHRIYSLHWSAVSNWNNGIYFMWNISGLGKTSLAIKLCQIPWYKFIGDENILIDHNWHITNWVKFIKFNKKSLFEYHDNALHNTYIQSHQNTKVEDENIPLKILIQPIVCIWWTLEVEKRDSLKIDFHLYEESSRRIRWISRRVNKFTIALQSLDTYNLSKKRIQVVKKISSSIVWYTIKWDIEKIITFINSLL